MPVMMDQVMREMPEGLTVGSTVGEYLDWARGQVAAGRVMVKMELGEQMLEGEELNLERGRVLGNRMLVLTTADRNELSLTMLGKLAALIEWLTPQHRQVAEMLERGETKHGLDRFREIEKAWEQIVLAYGKLAKMLELSLTELPVREMTGEAVLGEFCRQLEEIQGALTNNDYVLLADILQYEMDGAVANWMGLLEATLGVVEGSEAALRN